MCPALRHAELVTTSFLWVEIPDIQLSGCFSRPVLEFAFPLALRGVDRRAQAILAKFWMTSFGLELNAATRVFDLSTGQKQRLLLASCLALKPRILILSGAIDFLDPVFTTRLLPFLRHLCGTLGMTVILLTPGEPHLLDSVAFDRRISIGRLSSLTSPNRLARLQGSSGATSIRVSGLRHRFDGGRSELFNGLSFSVEQGRCLVLTGQNGSGKSTLGNIVAGACRPSEGKVVVCGQPAEHWFQSRSPKVTCALVDPDDIFTKATVAEEIASITNGAVSTEVRERLLSLLGLAEVLEIHPYDLDWLSRRRLGLFLAAASTEAILFIDEPLSLANEVSAVNVREVVTTLLAVGITVLIATNSPSLISTLDFARYLDLSTYTPARSSVSPAEDVASIPMEENTWAKATSNWYQNMPEFSHFWDTNVYPTLRRILPALKFMDDICLIDLGCGTGLQTLMVARVLGECGLNVKEVIVLDKQREFIDLANCLFLSNKTARFVCADLTSNDEVRSKLEQIGCRTSILLSSLFSLHDLSSMDGLKALLSDIGQSVDAFIAVIVSPEFAEQTLERASVKTVDRGGSKTTTDYQWACDFPLTRAGNNGFMVPYFHDRSIITWSCSGASLASN